MYNHPRRQFGCIQSCKAETAAAMGSPLESDAVQMSSAAVLMSPTVPVLQTAMGSPPVVVQSDAVQASPAVIPTSSDRSDASNSCAREP